MNSRIVPGSRVTLRCRVSNVGGELLDDGSRPVVFICGREAIIAGIERAVIGNAVGFCTGFTLAPADAYGLHRPELVFEAVRENLPPDLDLQPGMHLSPGGSEGKFKLKVVSLTERGAMLDGNHPFAGKHLVFDVEVLAVEPAEGADHA
jgi:FKBP-type peptidyl-prolyl cis-trans isomerase 2